MRLGWVHGLNVAELESNLVYLLFKSGPDTVAVILPESAISEDPTIVASLQKLYDIVGFLSVPALLVSTIQSLLCRGPTGFALLLA